MFSQVKVEVSKLLCDVLEESLSEIKLEVPREKDFGHICFPVFDLCKKKRKSPPELASHISEKIMKKKPPFLEKTEAVKGYVNFYLDIGFIQDVISSHEKHLSDVTLFSKGERKKKIVVDFSSPNVAKPMSVGHLRATVIGQAILNLAKAHGHDVVGLNHLGDWGVQFGKLIWAYKNWEKEYDFKNDPFSSLYDIYVRFHKEAEENPELNEKGSEIFKKLEQNDKELLNTWKTFTDISLKEYQRLWSILNVKHDLVKGESFYNDKIPEVLELLKEKNLLKKSEGALVVDLEDFKMPPCIIKKTDGASLYTTRDLASALYRKKELKCDLNFYVVGADQKLHFKQIFKVLELMGYPWSKDCRHIHFGMYRFKGEKLSTRKGNVIFLEDVLNQSVERAEKIIQEKNPKLENKKEVARKVGIGAIIFNDLSHDREKDVDFDWDKILNFEGDSGPYVQYTFVRCCSLLRKSPPESSKFKTLLETPEEQAVLRVLLEFDETLRLAFEHLKPHYVANYLLSLSREFNRFYNKHKILDSPLKSDRMVLVNSVQKTLLSGMKLLHMEAPEHM